MNRLVAARSSRAPPRTPGHAVIADSATAAARARAAHDPVALHAAAPIWPPPYRLGRTSYPSTDTGSRPGRADRRRPTGLLPELTRWVYELLDAHRDTARLAAHLEPEPDWAAHLDYLRDLQRRGREALAAIHARSGNDFAQPDPM